MQNIVGRQKFLFYFIFIYLIHWAPRCRRSSFFFYQNGLLFRTNRFNFSLSLSSQSSQIA